MTMENDTRYTSSVVPVFPSVTGWSY